ncbi:glycosyltransferase family 4 protein [bacterium]|nr:glycosyltransferase family 4 protein [bacterium]MCI0617808.1 glycosyltransferase family 4 protein [bacterium]
MIGDRIIGIDARELEGKPTGVGVYLKGILQELPLPARTRLQLYFRNSVPETVSNINAEMIVLKSANSNIAWQQWTLCREITNRNLNLFFSPANSLPWRFSGIQTLTVHDLSFFRYPLWFTAKERLSRQVNTSQSIRSADRIYTVSEFVKTEIVQRFGIKAERIRVTPNGVAQCEIDFTMRKMLRETRRLPNSKIILYTGSIFNRRHLPVLIGSLVHLDPSYVLIIVGENRTFPKIDLEQECEKCEVRNRVQILQYLPDHLLREYYVMADVFVYLSEYEGFGIPPLEAMCYGLPVIISDTPAMNTIYRDSAHFVSSLTPAAVADAIKKVLEDENEKSRLIAAGREIAARYNWRETARIISSDWEQLLDSSS